MSPQDETFPDGSTPSNPPPVTETREQKRERVRAEQEARKAASLAAKALKADLAATHATPESIQSEPLTTELLSVASTPPLLHIVINGQVYSQGEARLDPANNTLELKVPALASAPKPVPTISQWEAREVMENTAVSYMHGHALSVLNGLIKACGWNVVSAMVASLETEYTAKA
jgi:hypothetical protein